MSHKDVEYEVSSGSFEKNYKNPNDALVAAAEQAMARGESTLDVLVWSKAGAKAFGGDDAVERYEEDPEASVFERYEFKCNMVGRVP